MNRLGRGWRWLVAAAALALLVRWVGFSQLVETLRGTGPVALLAFLVGLALAAPLYGLQLWLALRLRGNRPPLRATVAAAVGSWSVGTLTPARAGDLSFVFLIRGRATESDALAVVLADKMISLTTLAMLACVSGYTLDLPYREALLVATIAACGAAWGVFYLAGSPVVRLVERWGAGPLIKRGVAPWGAMQELLRKPRALLLLGTTSLLRWLYICQVNVLIFMAFGYRPGPVDLISGTAVGRILSLLPVTIGGVGLKEPVQIVIYGRAGVPAEVVVAVSLVGMACGFLLAALWPLILGPRREASANG
jgi:hypothetical protein